MTQTPERVIAIDVGGTTLKGALVDRSGRATTVCERPTLAQAGAQAVIDAVLQFAVELAGEPPRPRAMAVAVPGLVDERAGVVLSSANLAWRDVPIGELLRERLALSVIVLHDVRAAALAEGSFGAARASRDYLLLTLGTWIGAAVVIDGRPYTGAHGLGGELGHVAVQPGGPRCGCGHQGCLEALASAGHIARRYSAISGQAETTSAEAVAQRAAAGDQTAHAVWREAIAALAVAIVNYATLLDPELVVIGGGMAAAGDQLFVPLRHALAGQIRFGEPPPLVPAQLGSEAGRHGAAIAAWREAGLAQSELSGWAP